MSGDERICASTSGSAKTTAVCTWTSCEQGAHEEEGQEKCRSDLTNLRRVPPGEHGGLSSLLDLKPDMLEQTYWDGAKWTLHKLDVLYSVFIIICAVSPGRTLQTGISSASVVLVYLLTLDSAAKLVMLLLFPQKWFRRRTLYLTLVMIWHGVATCLIVPGIHSQAILDIDTSPHVSWGTFVSTILWSSWISSHLIMSFGYYVPFKYAALHSMLLYVASWSDLQGLCRLFSTPGYREYIMVLYNGGLRIRSLVMGLAEPSVCPILMVALVLQFLGHLVLPLRLVYYFQAKSKSKVLRHWRRQQKVQVPLYAIEVPRITILQHIFSTVMILFQHYVVLLFVWSLSELLVHLLVEVRPDLATALCGDMSATV